jgi:competence protein ComEC
VNPSEQAGRGEARVVVADLRVLLLGAVAWVAALAGFVLPGRVAWALIAVPALPLVLPAGRAARWAALWIGLVLVAATVLLVTQLHLDAVRHSPVTRLASEQAVAEVELVVRSPPVRRHARYGDFVLFTASTTAVTGRGDRFRTRAPISVLLDGSARVVVGSHLRVRGRLRPALGPDLAAELQSRGPPTVLAGPGSLARLSSWTRAGIRDASADLGSGADALVPALVDGDESAAGGTGEFKAAFQTAGMTHLLAVSGTNLTLILGALLLLARWCRVRVWGLAAVGVLGVAGFVLLAGPEPSVLRAAAMGTVGLIGMGRAGRGRGRGIRALGTGVLVLVLFDPWLARSLGFVLSVVATAGILLLAPSWRDALAKWLPRWIAEAIAVPLAAQLACTPVIAAISGQVSLVAVGANMVVAPLVGPATVSGLLGGLVALISVPAGRLVTIPAGWCAQAIIAVAERAASLPVPVLPWSTGTLSILLLVILCLAAALMLRMVLVRRGLSLGLAGLVSVLVLVPLPTPGWPPAGWIMVACDVGQGDALVLRAGEHSAVVVDAGPDPALVDGCLRRLGVRSIPVLVISHFHADHVDGISGVMAGRRVGRVETSPLAEPASGAREIREAAAAAQVPTRVVTLGERTEVGALRWQVLGPVRARPPESESPPNDSSVVMLVETRGVRLLLMGDEERPAQGDLERTWPGLRVDVLKVAHHGSSKQNDELVRSLGARVALISVGQNNDYGHPSPRTLDLLTSAGMRVLRTDRDGDLAVVVDDRGEPATKTRGRGPEP